MFVGWSAVVRHRWSAVVRAGPTVVGRGGFVKRRRTVAGWSAGKPIVVLRPRWFVVVLRTIGGRADIVRAGRGGRTRAVRLDAVGAGRRAARVAIAFVVVGVRMVDQVLVMAAGVDVHLGEWHVDQFADATATTGRVDSKQNWFNCGVCVVIWFKIGFV